MNQFVDAAIIMSTNPHRIGFLVAQKSYDKPVIGHFAKAVGSIPVIRPQDNSVKGVGKVKFEGNLLHGQNTEFKKLLKGDKIRPGKTPDGYQVKEILSDTELVLTEMEREVGVITPLDEPQDEWMNYEILGFVDQSKVMQ
jgi:glycerol-3-phosphate O-acyltransferase/dihydroxyacetone phosphate acyltransferase